jgi:hypothetical protein
MLVERLTLTKATRPTKPTRLTKGMKPIKMAATTMTTLMIVVNPLELRNQPRENNLSRHQKTIPSGSAPPQHQHIHTHSHKTTTTTTIKQPPLLPHHHN